MVFSTVLVYGLAADALNAAAVAWVFALKRRVPSVDIPRFWCWCKTGRRWRPWWNGSFLDAPFLAGTGDGGVCGAGGPPPKPHCRDRRGRPHPLHPVAAALVQAVGGPLTGTSANISRVSPAAPGGLDLELAATWTPFWTSGRFPAVRAPPSGGRRRGGTAGAARGRFVSARAVLRLLGKPSVAIGLTNRPRPPRRISWFRDSKSSDRKVVSVRFRPPRR